MSEYRKSLEEKEQKATIKAETTKSQQSLLRLFDGNQEAMKSTRRDFLKLFGYSVGVASVAASCEMPVQKAIPYLIKPESITPGMASYFASTYFEENQYCSILVKVRDGRPIKIEGNDRSELSKGGTSARVQGSILSVYNPHRYKSPLINKTEVEWTEIDKQVIEKLSALKESNKKIVLLTSTIISPSTKAVIKTFKQAYPNTEVVTYDAVSGSGILEANSISFKKAALPVYNFEKANIVVSFGADFLGTWLDPVTYSKAYSKSKELTNGQKTVSKHYQIESNMSMTGTNADQRIVIKPSEEKAVIANLYNILALKTGNASIQTESVSHDLSELADDLLKHKGHSLVVSGSNDTESQLIVNLINNVLGNYGNTVNLSAAFNVKQGLDSDLTAFKSNLKNGNIGALIYFNTNPVYQLEGFGELVKTVETTISLSTQPNESTEGVQFICPDHTFLESWNDFEPVSGHYSLAQPTVAPIFKTRQAQESLLIWAGDNTSYYDFVKSTWNSEIYPKGNELSFKNFWNKSLQDGCVHIPSTTSEPLFDAAASVDKIGKVTIQTVSGLELALYEKVGIGAGEHANIPWLQEMPDPVSKATWDNYLTLSPKYAQEQKLKTGDIVKINDKIEVPVYIQPGQAYGTAGLALGYGRSNAGIVADHVGVNAYIFIEEKENRTYTTGINIEKTGEHKKMAVTQTHHSMEGRDLVRNASLEEYLVDEYAGNHKHKEIQPHLISLYEKQNFPGHHWGMAIDLNKCTGCSACVIACQVENNIPVVGRSEVSRVHEMHWIRIDRYYHGDIENPETLRQPVMCQHCDNAPCENVCPVAATNHSSEGLNQMAYNRCIGTRYCNNNCPYKVRRFNFFDFTGADAMKGNEYDVTGMTLDLPRMVLNPDVTIRSKGVIEKCSFCVQRIQEKKLLAKTENRMLDDGEITPACAQSCAADAIVFGDLNNKESKVAKFFENKRNYHLLEEIHTLPSVGYLTKIRNKKAEDAPGEIIIHNDHEEHHGA